MADTKSPVERLREGIEARRAARGFHVPEDVADALALAEELDASLRHLTAQRYILSTQDSKPFRGPLPGGTWQVMPFGWGFRVTNDEICDYGLKAVAETDNRQVALLTAAGPDLLAACELAIQLLDSDGKNLNSSIVIAARSAVAKAKGKTRECPCCGGAGKREKQTSTVTVSSWVKCETCTGSGRVPGAIED